MPDTDTQTQVHLGAVCAGYDRRTDTITIDLYGYAEIGPARVVSLSDDESDHLIKSIEHAKKCKRIAKGETNHGN